MARVTNQPADGAVGDDVVVGTERPADPVHADTVSDERVTTDAEVRDDMLAREKAAFGGMKFGSAFFGWLTAAGTAVLLTAVVAAIGTALGMADDDTVVSARGLGVAGAIAIAVVLFVAYLAGGYVAGRMARFSGAKQGVAVWLWALIAAVVLGVLGLILGAQFDVLSRLDAFPRIPLGEDMTAAGIITAIVFAAIALVGAVLGGLAGMRYHRRVDRAGSAD